jgi:glycosyltransferase involved in cell wall biosynthesis
VIKIVRSTYFKKDILMENKKPKLSIVIPVLNEEENIPLLNDRIKETLSEIDYEVIWVDDGSTDNTPKILAEISKDPKVHGITLMKRTGQSGGLMAGIMKARGEYIATIDGDNQNDPKDFIAMLEKLEQDNLDAIVGWRQNRWQGNVIRRIPSLAANKLMKMSFGDLGIHDTGCMVKVVKADIMKEIKLYGELHRFMSYLIGMYGAKMGEVPVSHKAREHGVSKYGFGRTLTVIFDILNVKFLSMTRKTPIQFMGPLALGTYFLGGLTGLYVILDKLITGADITGSPLFLITILSLIMGTQFLSFGLLGELVIRSYYEGGEKTPYAIRKEY